MAQVVIRNIDDAIVERLKARAAAEKKSPGAEIARRADGGSQALTRPDNRGVAKDPGDVASPPARSASGRRSDPRRSRQSMSIVVDASVALKWFLPEPDSAKAEELLGSHDILVAPTLIVSEVCNAVWKRLRRGETTAQHADWVPDRIGTSGRC